jgi:hypothetical protein
MLSVGVRERSGRSRPATPTAGEREEPPCLRRLLGRRRGEGGAAAAVGERKR